MESIDLLRRMIAPTAQVQLEVLGDKASVALTEPQQPDSKLNIRGLPPDAIVIKMDCFSAPDTLFTCKMGECKRADYAIIAVLGRKKCVLFVELKRTKASRGDVEKQLRGAKCVLDYCKRIAAEFYGAKSFLDGYRLRFVSCGHTSVNKRKTRYTRTDDIHDRPERFLQVDWPANLDFNRLVGAWS